jgi:hypothetical protein
MVAGYCGVHNRNADKTEYEFINVFTFERLSGTRHDLMDRVENFNASAVILGTLSIFCITLSWRFPKFSATSLLDTTVLPLITFTN